MDREELERRHKHRSERHAQLAERYKHDTLLAMTADEAFQADETVLALLSHIRELEGALREMVYETTHLSPQEDDGSHWAKISKAALSKARQALKDQS